MTVFREVKALQEDLQKAGVYDGPINGRYDEATHVAVFALADAGKAGDAEHIPDPIADGYGSGMLEFMDELGFTPAAAEAVRVAYSEYARQAQASAPAVLSDAPPEVVTVDTESAEDEQEDNENRVPNPPMPSGQPQAIRGTQAVQVLQQSLSRAKLYSGQVSGIYDQATEIAFAKWVQGTGQRAGYRSIDGYLTLGRPSAFKTELKVARDNFLSQGGQKVGIAVPTTPPVAVVKTTGAAMPVWVRSRWFKWLAIGTVAGSAFWLWRRHKRQQVEVI